MAQTSAPMSMQQHMVDGCWSRASPSNIAIMTSSLLIINASFAGLERILGTTEKMDAVGRNRALSGPADCGQDRRRQELVRAQPQISCRFDRSPSPCNVDISPRKRSYRPAGLCWTQRSQILTGSWKVYPRFQSADILHVIPHEMLDMVHAVCGDFSGSFSSSESPRPTVFAGC